MEGFDAAGQLEAATLPAALEVQGLATRPALSMGGQAGPVVLLLELDTWAVSDAG